VKRKEKGNNELSFKATFEIEICWTGNYNLRYAKYTQPLGKQ